MKPVLADNPLPLILNPHPPYIKYSRHIIMYNIRGVFYIGVGEGWGGLILGGADYRFLACW